jgi:hypothetical protein
LHPRSRTLTRRPNSPSCVSWSRTSRRTSRRPCPLAYTAACTPLHACTPRTAPACDRNAGRKRARTGSLRYFLLGTLHERSQFLRDLKDKYHSISARRSRITPKMSQTKSIQGVHACRRNRGETPPPPPQNGEKRSERGEGVPPPENRCTPARFVCLQGSGGRRSAKTSKDSDGSDGMDPVAPSQPSQELNVEERKRAEN